MPTRTRAAGRGDRWAWVAVVLMALCACGPLWATGQERKSATSVDAVVEVDLRDLLQPSFHGMGVQCSSYPEYDVSDEDWEKVFHRLEFMRLSFTRVMLAAPWYCKGFDDEDEPVYDWDSELMQRLYRLLDWCEERDALVMIGEWGRPSGEGLDLANDDPRWARIVADFVAHMLHVKKYTCIKYYNLINEPHWFVRDRNEWRRAILNLHSALSERGLTERITIAVPDANEEWTLWSLEDPGLRDAAGVYDEHWYIMSGDIAEGKIEERTRRQVEAIKARDPGKPYVLGEMGLHDDWDRVRDAQYHVYDFWYGVSMADAAAQMMRGGSSGVIAWYLDDSMHGVHWGLIRRTPRYFRRKIWGFWSILGAEHGMPEDENMRPWFYPWSLLTRYFRQGGQTLRTPDTGIEGLRVAAVRHPAEGKFHFSIVVVNNSDAPRSARIALTGSRSGRTTLSRYDYFDSDGDNKVDAWPDVVDAQGRDIFPEPTATLEGVELSSGVTVQLPCKGVVFLTTEDGGESVWLANGDS